MSSAKLDEPLVLRVGEAGPRGAAIESLAYPELVIGELNGPVGNAIAMLTGDQVQGHTRALALLDTGIAVRPVTLMVSKATITNRVYAELIFGPVQFGVANGVLDAVRAGLIPKPRVNSLGIVVSVWLDPNVIKSDSLDQRALFEANRRETLRALEKALTQEPNIDWLLDNQSRIVHEFYRAEAR